MLFYGILFQIVEAQLENKNFNTPLPPTTAGLDASPAFFFEESSQIQVESISRRSGFADVMKCLKADLGEPFPARKGLPQILIKLGGWLTAQ
jgi:hypothetical protein